EREFERVGSTQPIPTDVRVIAATNRDLAAAVAERRFRADLFYRLNVFPIEVPPLRDRRADIPLLVDYFMRRCAERAGKEIRGVSIEMSGLLHAYEWPGNVRELQNIVERAVILCDSDTLSIEEHWLGKRAARPRATGGAATTPVRHRDAGGDPGCFDGKQGAGRGTVRRAKERGGGSRWDGNVHYFDYKADTVRPDTTRIEGYVVAEAFIYDHTRTTEKVTIAVLVTSEELEVEKLPREEAIRIGEAIRNQAVANHRAKLPGGHRTVVFNLRGHQIETKEE